MQVLKVTLEGILATRKPRNPETVAEIPTQRQKPLMPGLDYLLWIACRANIQV